VVIAVRASGENHKPSQWSKLIALPVIAPVEKPSDLTLTPDPKGIRVAWRSTARDFRVLRKEGDEAFKVIATTSAPEYFDAGATLGKTYSYQVMAFQTVGQNREAQSDLSALVDLAYKDVFAPAVPSGLRASASAGSIELSWESNGEPDLAGYRVYRSTDGGGFERVGEVNLPAYSDRQAQTGHAYRYAITAFDQSGNESQRSAPVEAALR
jgi:fibronectin type 3 domain-containing protein